MIVEKVSQVQYSKTVNRTPKTVNRVLLTTSPLRYTLIPMKTHYIIPIFIPHLGCPYTCVFCSQKKISGALKPVKPSEITRQINKYLKTIPRKGARVEAGFFGGSFTALPIPQQKRYLEKAHYFIKKHVIHGIRLSTRPDCITQEILDMLKTYGVTCIELGVQSISDKVLKAAKRGHTASDVIRASELITKNGFILGHQIMVGLPESTSSDEIKTAEEAARLRAEFVRIYPVLVIKDTELEKIYRSGKYAVLSEETAVKRCAGLLALFRKRKIDVIRIGLHPSEGLLSGKNLVAGPFHEAFRQKVETYLYGRLFKKIISKKDSKHISRILYNPSDTAYVIGYKRQNAHMVENALHKYNIFKPNPKTPANKIIVAYKTINKFINPTSYEL